MASPGRTAGTQEETTTTRTSWLLATAAACGASLPTLSGNARAGKVPWPRDPVKCFFLKLGTENWVMCRVKSSHCFLGGHWVPEEGQGSLAILAASFPNIELWRRRGSSPAQDEG